MPFSPPASLMWCAKDKRRASLTIACSIKSSLAVWGMVVGLIILFKAMSQSSFTLESNGSQRRMFSNPASFTTLQML